MVLLSVGALQNCLDSSERSAVLSELTNQLDDLSLGLTISEIGGRLLRFLLSKLLVLGFRDVISLLFGLFEWITGPFLLSLLFYRLLIIIIEVLLLIGVTHNFVLGKSTHIRVVCVLLHLDHGVNLFFLLLLSGIIRTSSRAARG